MNSGNVEPHWPKLQNLQRCRMSPPHSTLELQDRPHVKLAGSGLGFVVPEPDAVVCSEADVGLFRFYELAAAAFGEEAALSLARTIGASMARLADGAISIVRISCATANARPWR